MHQDSKFSQGQNVRLTGMPRWKRFWHYDPREVKALTAGGTIYASEYSRWPSGNPQLVYTVACEYQGCRYLGVMAESYLSPSDQPNFPALVQGGLFELFEPVCSIPGTSNYLYGDKPISGIICASRYIDFLAKQPHHREYTVYNQFEKRTYLLKESHMMSLVKPISF